LFDFYRQQGILLVGGSWAKILQVPLVSEKKIEQVNSSETLSTLESLLSEMDEHLCKAHALEIYKTCSCHRYVALIYVRIYIYNYIYIYIYGKCLGHI